MRGLNIIQYNCGNAKGKATKLFLDSIDPEAFPVIAIQEPMVMENQRGHTRCLRNFWPSWLLKQGARVVFFIHEHIPSTNCETFEATDLCEKIWIKVGRTHMHLINMYSPPSQNNRRETAIIEAWPDLARMLEPLQLRTIIIGDFNAHHSEWAGPTAAREPKADHLWRHLQARGFRLLKEQGVAIWKRGLRKVVLDLGFASGDIANRIMTYRPRNEWTLTKDYLLIEIWIDTEPLLQQKYGRLALKKA
jgi:exonuclease III